MPNPKIPLQPGNFYHIYNRGINGCPVFRENDNYGYFLSLYDKYISPVAETYAWVLMGNHFHFLLRIQPDPEGFENLQGPAIEKKISHHFSNLFNAYSKAFNKRYQRTGSLFEHTFRRKLVDNTDYLKRTILYIHNNPVRHGFCSHPAEYPWSSYLSIISLKPTKLRRDTVLGWFTNEATFKTLHSNATEPDDIDDLFE